MKNGPTTKDTTRARRWFIRVLMTTILVAGILPLFGFTYWGDEQEIRDVLLTGAELHLSRQGTYSNACGDSYGPPDIPEIAGTWEWVVDSGSTCWNVAGISATGLLAAYERTHVNEYLDASLLLGDTLVEKFEIISADGSQWEDRPFSHDIEFLVRLGKASRDWSYIRTARSWHDVITDNETAEAIADRLIDKRLSLAGWDLASQIRAALQVGKWRYALAIAKRLLERRADWEGVPLGSYDYTTLSHASLLWALYDVRFGGRDITAARREFQAMILDGQEPNGSWDDGSFQTTAYAILGLETSRSGRHKRKVLRRALGNAFIFLRDSQTADGGWSYPPEYGEVNSEVLIAISALSGCEITVPADLASSHIQLAAIDEKTEAAKKVTKPTALPVR